MKKIISFLILICFCLTLVGCGETISGIGKDASRMGRGVKTIFIKDSSDE